MTTAASQNQYSPGLEGVIAGQTAIAQVNPDAGLRYRGYDVHELAKQCTFEQVAWLLIHGELPDQTQLAQFRTELVKCCELPDAVIQMLRLLPRDMHPMDVIRSGVSMLAGFDPALNDLSHDANVGKSYRLIGAVLALSTTGWRILHGQKPVKPRVDLNHAGNFLYTLSGKLPEDWCVKALDLLFILYAEHDFNASTFAARVTASTLSDIYAAITTAIGTLKGALHGGANEEAMKDYDEIGSAQNADQWVRDKLASKQKIMGFGHRVYKKGDSRVPIMRELAREIGQRTAQPQYVAIGQAMEESMQRHKGLIANADLYAAPLFHMMKIPVELNTPIFACARVAGWCAHVIEQHDGNRIIRPRSLYVGSPPRSLP